MANGGPGNQTPRSTLDLGPDSGWTVEDYGRWYDQDGNQNDGGLDLSGFQPEGPYAGTIQIGPNRYAAVDANGNILASFSGPSGGRSGGGGGGPAGPSQLDYDMFDWRQHMDMLGFGLDERALGLQETLGLGGLDLDQQAFQRQQNLDQFNNSMSLMDFALSVGDFDLARQAQEDANYWRGQNQMMDAAQMGLQARGQDIDMALGMAGIGQQAAGQRAQSALGFGGLAAESGLGAQGQMLDRASMQEQGARALLGDATARQLGVMGGQIDQFSNETQRAAAQAAEQRMMNEFLLNASTSPRDLMGLYFMQRGVAPDWDTMAAGGTPAMGSGLAPGNPLDFFQGLETMPDFSAASAPNPYAGQVGSFAGALDMMSPEDVWSMVQGGANFGSSMVPDISAGGGGMGGVGPANLPPMQAPAPPPRVTPNPVGDYPGLQPTGIRAPAHNQPSTWADINPGGEMGGVPLSRINPGWNLATVGGHGTNVGNFDPSLGVFGSRDPSTRLGQDEFIPGGTQVWVRAPGTWGQ